MSATAAHDVVAAIIASGDRAIAIPGDVGNEKAVHAMFDLAEDQLGPVTGLVNNAGILHRAAPFRDLTLARWEQSFATNTTGTHPTEGG